MIGVVIAALAGGGAGRIGLVALLVVMVALFVVFVPDWRTRLDQRAYERRHSHHRRKGWRR